MGLYDRDYTQDRYQHMHTGRPTLGSLFPKPPTVVGKLLLINVIVFLVLMLLSFLQPFVYSWFSVAPLSFWRLLQPWRFITYQFLHDPTGIGHILWNMLGLYFFGSMVERLWGPKKFLIFYLACGAVGGILYSILAFAGFMRPGYLIGASGAIYGVLAAAAIYFPRTLVYIWAVFPIPLGLVALLYFLGSLLTLHRGENTGGELAHLAGMAAGAAYVLSQGWRNKITAKIQKGQWQKKIAAQRKLQAELDRILEKVHDCGINSLTAKEKNTLKQATKAEQLRNKL